MSIPVEKQPQSYFIYGTVLDVMNVSNLEEASDQDNDGNVVRDALILVE